MSDEVVSVEILSTEPTRVSIEEPRTEVIVEQDAPTEVQINLVGIQGPRGPGWLTGNGNPSDGTGRNGDYYLDADALALYGPKADDEWPSEPLAVFAAASAGGLVVVDGAATFILDYTAIALATDDPDQALDATPALAIKYIVRADNGTDAEVTEILAVVKGAIVNHVEYGRVTTGDDLATYDVILDGAAIELTASPYYLNTSFRIVKQILVS